MVSGPSERQAFSKDDLRVSYRAQLMQERIQAASVAMPGMPGSFWVSRSDEIARKGNGEMHIQLAACLRLDDANQVRRY